jgi:hypothetical protein
MSKLPSLGGVVCSALLLIAACSAQTPEQRAVETELAALAPLRQSYPVVTGFDVRTPTTLVVSLDLQTYIGMSDEDTATVRRAVVERWRTAWIQAHPNARAVLHVRFIDFIGRTVAEKITSVR